MIHHRFECVPCEISRPSCDDSPKVDEVDQSKHPPQEAQQYHMYRFFPSFDKKIPDGQDLATAPIDVDENHATYSSDDVHPTEGPQKSSLTKNKTKFENITNHNIKPGLKMQIQNSTKQNNTITPIAYTKTNITITFT